MLIYVVAALQYKIWMQKGQFEYLLFVGDLGLNED